MQKAGYSLIAPFTLPEKCWTDLIFIPQKAHQKAFLEKMLRNKAAEDFVEYMKYEAELYSKYKQYYGYVFILGKNYKKMK